ncbi:hypothetical protein [Hyphomicrobium sp.]|uniref:hypothetical protein n=1 Tax=Hyphomicrobium sp. TaxID=82 RepID=UPI003F6F53C4
MHAHGALARCERRDANAFLVVQRVPAFAFVPRITRKPAHEQVDNAFQPVDEIVAKLGGFHQIDFEGDDHLLRLARLRVSAIDGSSSPSMIGPENRNRHAPITSGLDQCASRRPRVTRCADAAVPGLRAALRGSA